MDFKVLQSKQHEITHEHYKDYEVKDTVQLNKKTHSCTYEVSDREFWDVEDNRAKLLQMLAYDGIGFEYENGVVKTFDLDTDDSARKFEIREEAFRRYYNQRKEPTKNKKMEALLAQLPGYKKFDTWLPFRTLSSDTVIFMFPKDNPAKSWTGMEVCDVIVYDRSFEKYFIVKGKGNGFDEILINGVACRTGLSDGGYFVRLRENAILHTVEDSKLYLLKEDVEMKPRFTDKELSEALYVYYGLHYKKVDEESCP